MPDSFGLAVAWAYSYPGHRFLQILEFKYFSTSYESGTQVVLYAIGLLEASLYRKCAMLICCDESRKVIYLAPEGDLLAKEAESMHRQVQAYARHEVEALVLDLARVRTIDPFGLHTILLLYNQLCRSRGELIIENASRELKKIFQLLRIDGRLTISQTGWPC